MTMQFTQKVLLLFVALCLFSNIALGQRQHLGQRLHFTSKDDIKEVIRKSPKDFTIRVLFYFGRNPRYKPKVHYRGFIISKEGGNFKLHHPASGKTFIIPKKEIDEWIRTTK